MDLLKFSKLPEKLPYLAKKTVAKQYDLAQYYLILLDLHLFSNDLGKVLELLMFSKSW